MNKLKTAGYAIAAFAGAVILAVAAYCATLFMPEKKYASGEDNDISAVAEKVMSNVLEVKCGSSIATGFVFKQKESRTFAVTCWHTVKSDPLSAEFRFSGKSEFVKDAELIGFDPDYDVAVYEIAASGVFAEIKVNTAAKTGEEVFLLGNSKGDGIALFSGKVSVPDDIVLCADSAAGSNIDGKSLPAVRITAPVNYGSSGAPVFDRTGRLVGMGFYQVFGTSERPVYDENYTVPAVIIEALVNVYEKKKGETPRSAVTLKNYIKGEGETAFRVYEAQFKKLWPDSVFCRENDAVYAYSEGKKVKVLGVAGKQPSTMAEFLAAAVYYEIFGGDYITE